MRNNLPIVETFDLVMIRIWAARAADRRSGQNLSNCLQRVRNIAVTGFDAISWGKTKEVGFCEREYSNACLNAFSVAYEEFKILRE